jgi:HEPN domain-containing protein
MSLEKNRQEAERWLKTGEGDLETAIILKENDKYAPSCFHAQQAGEKALKAVWFLLDADPWGHSITKLINDLEHVDSNIAERFEEVKKDAIMLDRFYIPTRYPNGLPELTPDEAFLKEDAQACIENAKNIIGAAKNSLMAST